jgi:hypothetical protein
MDIRRLDVIGSSIIVQGHRLIDFSGPLACEFHIRHD